MIIETKFDLGEKVYAIQKERNMIEEECPICEGTARIEKNGEKFSCPKIGCKSGQIITGSEPKWVVKFEGVIGKIDVDLYYSKYNHKDEYRYMLDTTGVGTGSVWYQHLLFKTKEAAQERCNELNEKEIFGLEAAGCIT